MRAAVFVVLLAGCQSVADAWPGERFAPGVAWADWWDATAACAGVHPAPSFERVNWWVAPDGALGPQVMGRWVPPHDIYLARFVLDARVEGTIRHEMLHDLLQAGGDERWHPPEFATCKL